MNGNEIFIDTNICIYLLNGNLILSDLLQDQQIYISVITEIELYAYYGELDAGAKVLDSFAESVTIVDINHDIKQKTISIRKNAKLKLPDCIIAASAISKDLAIITADKSFKKVEGLDLIEFEKV